MENKEVIFVFGANQAGRHGAGAALKAKKQYGAITGKGEGHFGSSYAIPTKNYFIQTRSNLDIQLSVKKFVEYAKSHPELTFQVTRIGCGLAGLKDETVAPWFKDAPSNCQFDEVWRPYLEEKNFWGTYKG